MASRTGLGLLEVLRGPLETGYERKNGSNSDKMIFASIDRFGEWRQRTSQPSFIYILFDLFKSTAFPNRTGRFRPVPAITEGPPERLRWGNNRHLPGEEAWLVGEWRSSGERKYYLSNLPPDTSRRALAGTIKARWVCEQAHQQLKEELGLDHFEGRSWTGLHRHALMTCIACAYLQHLRLAEHRRTGREKMTTRLPAPPPSPSLPAVRQAIIGRLFANLVPPVLCPYCRRHFRLPPNVKVPR